MVEFVLHPLLHRDPERIYGYRILIVSNLLHPCNPVRS